MTTALAQLLRRFLPPAPGSALSSEPVATRVRLRDATSDLEVHVNGAGSELLHVSRVGAGPQSVARGRAMLSIEDDAGALRIDIPVTVISGGERAWVLRMIAPPLVLRRRTIRDLALAEALGGPTPPLGMVA